jgi:hypothetical protein
VVWPSPRAPSSPCVPHPSSPSACLHFSPALPLSQLCFDFRLHPSRSLPSHSASASTHLSLSLSLSRWRKRNRGSGMLQASTDWGKMAMARRRPLLATARTGGHTARRWPVSNFSRQLRRAAASGSPPALLLTAAESSVRLLSPSRSPAH